MQPTKEISALFTLIDDPDEEVFNTVSERIVHLGKTIIPNLENLWENTVSESVQERIEMLIHRLHLGDLQTALTAWHQQHEQELLPGALHVARYQYPELPIGPVIQEMEKIKRNVWLELNSFLTPLEQANVISSIVYNYYNLKGSEISYTNPDDFFIHKVLETKKGNTLSNGILYLILAEMLAMPVKAINVPKQFVLAFFNNDYSADTHGSDPQRKIHFYVDATTGQVFNHKDLEVYFKKIAVPLTPFYFKPLNNARVIQVLLEELSRCFEADNVLYKKMELLELARLLD
jgi:regulator of sirC expression with transglutaminase-like and TPR domain